MGGSGVHVSDVLREFHEHGAVADERTLRALLRDYARAGSQLENDLVELKREFHNDSEAWLVLLKEVVAFANSSGGVLVYGVDETHQRVGVIESLGTYFDPANVSQKLHRYAPNAAVSTAYCEVLSYNKRYGFLFVGRANKIIVFDKPGNIQPPSGRQKTLLQPGVVYYGLAEPQPEGDERQAGANPGHEGAICRRSRSFSGERGRRIWSGRLFIHHASF